MDLKPVHLTEENFDQEAKQAEVPVFIDFWASWCAPCMMMAPVFEELAAEYHESGRAKLCKLSTEEYPGLAQEYGIRGIPTLLVLYKGQEVDRIVGFAPKDIIKQKMEEAIAKAR